MVKDNCLAYTDAMWAAADMQFGVATMQMQSALSQHGQIWVAPPPGTAPLSPTPLDGCESTGDGETA